MVHPSSDCLMPRTTSSRLTPAQRARASLKSGSNLSTRCCQLVRSVPVSGSAAGWRRLWPQGRATVARSIRRTGDAGLELPRQAGTDGERSQQHGGLRKVLLQPGRQLAHQRADVAMVVKVDDQLAIVRRERLGIDRQVEAAACADEAGDASTRESASSFFSILPDRWPPRRSARPPPGGSRAGTSASRNPGRTAWSPGRSRRRPQRAARPRSPA